LGCKALVIVQATAKLEESISKFVSLGLAVQITKLDVSVYQRHQRREERQQIAGLPQKYE